MIPVTEEFRDFSIKIGPVVGGPPRKKVKRR